MRHGLYETIVCYVLLANMIWIVVLERDRLKALMDLSVIVSWLWIVNSERNHLIVVDRDMFVMFKLERLDVAEFDSSATIEHRFEKILLLTWHDSSEPTNELVCDSVTPRSLPQHDSSTPYLNLNEHVDLNVSQIETQYELPVSKEPDVGRTQEPIMEEVRTQEPIVEEVRTQKPIGEE
ncbi:hypothetical protein Tco_1537171, partial [Tanacetum coccineum]